MEYIYCYTNKSNGHQYVGQTNNIKRRYNEHWSNANNINSSEYNLLFHQKLREYGKDNFDFVVLEEIDTDNLELVNQREEFWINKLQTYAGFKKGGYNLTYGGDNMQHNIIYNAEIINAVKQEIKQGTPYNEINDKYKISIGYISGINTGLYFYDENESYPLFKYMQNETEVQKIIDLLTQTTIPMTEIAKITNKAYSTIKKINYGLLWHNETVKYPLRKISKIDETANKIKQLLLEGYDIREIAEITNTSIQTVKRINNGQTHHDSQLSYPLKKPVSTI